MRVHISPFGLIARAELEPDEKLSVADITRRLAEAGVVAGLLPDAIERLAASELGCHRRRIVAKGSVPRRGANASIEYLFDPVVEPRPWLARSGNYCSKDLARLSWVAEGQPLARKRPPEMGRPGLSVKGMPIPGRLGLDRAVNVGFGASKAPDGCVAVSRVRGLPALINDRIVVFPVLRLHGRFLANRAAVDFDGDVTIEGAAERSLSVHALGDIVVTESVRGATLMAGANILVKHAVSHHSQLIAGRNIVAKTAEYSLLEAGDTVSVVGDLTFCTVSACQLISVGGRAIGSTLRADAGVKAGILGGRLSARTTVILDPERTRSRRLSEAEARLEYAKARLSQSAVEARPDLKTLGLKDLRDCLRDYIRARNLVASKVAPLVSADCIYPGVEIRIRDSCLVTTALVSDRTLFEAQGKLIEVPLHAWRTGKDWRLPSGAARSPVEPGVERRIPRLERSASVPQPHRRGRQPS